MPVSLKGNTVARREWKRITGILEPVGYITELDAKALEGYVMADALVARYWDLVGKTDLDEAIVKGYVGQLHKWTQERSRQMARLGLTPKDRASLRVVTPEKDDDIRKFLKGGKAS